MSGVNDKNRIIVGEFPSSIAVYEFSRSEGGYNLIACEYGLGQDANSVERLGLSSLWICPSSMCPPRYVDLPPLACGVAL